MIRFATKESKFSDETLKLCGINIEKIVEENIVEKRIQELNKRGVGFCSKGHPLVMRWGSHGLFLSCGEFSCCRDTIGPTADLVGEVFGKKYLQCEKCGSPMEIKFNPRRKSRFLGCSRYPECHFTRPLWPLCWRPKMGCLPWIIGGIAWAVTVALTDSGWLGFVAGVGGGILVAVVAKRMKQHGASPATKPPERTETPRPIYVSHCWRCQSPITSRTHRNCAKCGWYICNECGECGCRYKRFEEARRRHQ